MKLKVIYILGYGRSGSTILGSLLGQHAQAVNVGEMVQLPNEGWRLNNYCACGQRGNDCHFWSEVKHRWLQLSDLGSVDEYISMQRRYLGVSASLPYIRPNAGSEPENLAAAQATAALYRAVAEVSGKNIIIDSSKLPQWAFAVSAVPDIDLRVIHLVRDGRSTAHSLAKTYQRDDVAGVQMDILGRPVWSTAFRWSVYNLLSEYFITTSRVPSLRLRYEDFTSNPSAALDNIGHLADMDYAAVAADVKAGKPLLAGHAIAGNRLRMNREIHLRSDDSSISKLNTVDEILFWAASGLMALRYGYRPGLWRNINTKGSE